MGTSPGNVLRDVSPILSQFTLITSHLNAHPQSVSTAGERHSSQASKLHPSPNLPFVWHRFHKREQLLPNIVHGSWKCTAADVSGPIFRRISVADIKCSFCRTSLLVLKLLQTGPSAVKQNLWRYMKQGSHRLKAFPVIQLRVSKHWRRLIWPHLFFSHQCATCMPAVRHQYPNGAGRLWQNYTDTIYGLCKHLTHITH